MMQSQANWNTNAGNDAEWEVEPEDPLDNLSICSSCFRGISLGEKSQGKRSFERSLTLHVAFSANAPPITGPMTIQRISIVMI
jgi:hypothetical protein